MANPDPNLRPDLQRERERHAGPLIGIALVVLFALALLFWWMMDEAAEAPGPNTTIEQNDVDVTTPPAAEGEGAVDLPDQTQPDVVTPEPAPDLTPAPDTTTGGTTGGATEGTTGGATGGTTSGTTGGTTTTP